MSLISSTGTCNNEGHIVKSMNSGAGDYEQYRDSFS